MLLKDRISTFTRLGDFLLSESNFEQIKEWAIRARNENAWFTEDNVRLSIENIAKLFLNPELLESFSLKYLPSLQHSLENPQKIGLVLAGNIPTVGFHDLLLVILSGHQAHLKLSSSDNILIKLLVNQLISINPDIKNLITIADKLNDADAFIATGSDNTAKYFEYYFSKKPHIIRKNRTSVAVLTGEESKMELANLGNDIFQYFGLGCRNVSKIYVPRGYSFDKFFESIEYWNTIVLHHKYNNNYDYNKSIYLINLIPHFDNGFLLLKEDETLVSPISVCYFEYYENEDDLKQKISKFQDKIQCIVSKNRVFEGGFSFGEAQSPTLSDFADGVDTMRFLVEVG
jgi:hypothetical protein